MRSWVNKMKKTCAILFIIHEILTLIPILLNNIDNKQEVNAPG